MTTTQRRLALEVATDAARRAGTLLRAHLHRPKKVHETGPHDIKLELDVRSQELISRILTRAFPDIPILGEEGIDPKVESAPARWVVDPIDGTVNFAHGIPHCCISIALQERIGDTQTTTMGMIHDPFVGETWTALYGRQAKRNGRIIRVSERSSLNEAVLSVGFAKSSRSLNETLPVFNHLISRVRKVRIMGSAALALAYVADGRFDAYVESGIRLWDIAAGALIVECAGGKVSATPLPGIYCHRLIAVNPRLEKTIHRVVRSSQSSASS